MIDEDVLRGLFADAAESVPPPGDAPAGLLAEIEAQAEGRSIRAPGPPRARRGRRTRRVLEVAALVAILAVGLAYLTGGSSDRATSFSSTGAAIGGVPPQDDQVLDGGGGTSSGAPSTPSGPVASDSAKVVKTGSLDLEVPEGSFQEAVDRITSQVVGLGGYLSESTVRESDDVPSGSLVARVPAKSFEPLVASLQELGEVRSVTSKGTDVSAQLTDLDARLAALRATRDRLGTVLAAAESVPDILAVQDRITEVQVQIEQLEGQQQVLADQAAMGTLSITVGEPGAERLEPEGAPDDGLGDAWSDARHSFGEGVEHLVAWSGPAALVLILGLVVLVVGRLGWVLWRRRTV